MHRRKTTSTENVIPGACVLSEESRAMDQVTMFKAGSAMGGDKFWMAWQRSKQKNVAAEHLLRDVAFCSDCGSGPAAACAATGRSEWGSGERPEPERSADAGGWPEQCQSGTGMRRQ